MVQGLRRSTWWRPQNWTIFAIWNLYWYVAHIHYKICLSRPSPNSFLYSFWLCDMYVYIHALYTHILNHSVTNFMLSLSSNHFSFLLIYWIIYFIFYLLIILLLTNFYLSCHWKNGTRVTWLVTPVNHYSFIFINYLNCGQHQ